VTRDIERRVRAVLQAALSLNASGDEIARVERADDLLGLDSIATLEFALALEKEFGITLDPESLDAEVFADLAKLCAHIERRLREGR
jgi:acyl carrier protein